MNQNKVMPVGVDDFKKLREQYYFVDKTRFIQELIEGHSQVTLIARPRRFGKTLMMSMLYYFFTNKNAKENRSLFDGCRIAEAGEKYMAEQGTRPVVFLSLKDVKGDTFASLMTALQNVLQTVYLEFRELLESEALDEAERAFFVKVKNMEAAPDQMQFAVSNLAKYLCRFYARKPILLIDEYDAPIQSAWEHGYYDKAIGFFRNFLSAALKSNPALDFAVLTGVLRIAKESIFSALNNLEVSSVISGRYAEAAGFTKEEIEKMAADIGMGGKLDELKDWYDGYNFSGREIYNPWSVINYFHMGGKPGAYWVNTSGNGILAELLEQADDTQEKNLYALFQMHSIGTQIKETVIYADIYKDRAALYTMLLTTGYLTVVPGVFGDDAEYCTVAIPNKEIRTVYASEILNRIQRMGAGTNPAAFLEQLLLGNAEEFSRELSRYLETVASYYDTAKQESFYHGLMLGMMALFTARYHIRSNRESGYGRFDLAAFPKKQGQSGILMEFKVAETEAALEREAAAALKQMEDMDYMAEFRAQGIETVWKYGIAFCGKKLKMVRG